MNRHFFKLFFGTLFLFAASAFTGCSDDDTPGGAPELKADPETLAFTGAEESKEVAIASNCDWEVVENLDWLTVSPEKGTGNGKITVTASELPTGSRTGTISFKLIHPEYGEWGAADSKVAVTQTAGDIPGPSPGDPIYSENCGTSVSKVDDRWPYVDAFEGWQRGGSLDQKAVTYGGKSSSVRNSGAAYDPDPADGISGPPYVTVKTFDIEHVNIESKTNFTFTFVAQNTVSTLPDSPYTPTFGDIAATTFKFSVSMDGTTFSPVQFTPVKTASSWYKCTAEFKLPAGATASELTFRMDGFSGGTTLRVDDFNLFEGGNGAELGKGDDPVVGDAVKTTIPELVAKCEAAGSQQVAVDETNDYWFEAVVVTDVDGGNTVTNNLQVMTPGATTAGNGIMLYGSGQYTNPADDNFTLKAGDKVKVTLKAGQARVTTYNKMHELTGSQGADWVVVEKIGTETVTPVTVTVSQLTDFQSMAVKIASVTAPAASASWCTADASGNHTFKSGSEDLTVYVQKGATAFVDQVFTGGATGSISGVATLYRGAAQIAPRTLADVADFVSSAPAITAVSPASLTFAATDEAKSVTVTTANDAGCTIEAVSSNPTQFGVSVNGKVVTVTPSENATAAEITATLTINLMKAGSAVDTRTVAIKQNAKPASGDKVITMTYDDIVAGKNGSVELASGGYGSQDVANESTWYTWTFSSENFTGARIAMANGDNGELLQMQGDAELVAKQAFWGNANELGKISKIVITSQATGTRGAYHLYAGDAKLPAANAITADQSQLDDIVYHYTTSKGVEKDVTRHVYVDTYDLSGGDYSYFAVRNDLKGALYIQQVEITYTR